MSQRQSRIAWGVTLGLCGFLCVGLSLGQAPAEATKVETLLPSNAVLYVSAVGQEAQQEAWEKTAAHDALHKTGLMAVLEKTFASLGAQAEQNENAQALQKGLEHIQKKGFSLAVSLPAFDENGPPAPPFPTVTVVLHQAAELNAGLTELLKQNAPADVRINEEEIEGRRVMTVPIPEAPLPITVSWWSEGPHLVIATGLNAAQTAINVAAGKSSNITADANWKKYAAADAGFDVAYIGWFDFGSLRKRFGEIEIPVPGTAAGQPAEEIDAALDVPRIDQVAAVRQAPKTIKVNDVLKALGLDTVGSLVSRTGYKGRSQWSETTLEAPAPRRGLLAYWDQEPITLKDLPPLPFGQNGFYGCSVDWSKFYDTTITIARDLARLGPEEMSVQIEGGIQNIEAIVGFDPKTELFDPLGNVFCAYSDTRQGILGLGSGLVFKVDDAETLRQTLKKLVDRAAQQTKPEELTVVTTSKQGRDIVTLQIANGLVNPSFAVGDDWLAIGLFPQTVEAFLLRVDGKLTNWRPTLSYERSLAEMPKQFTSIAASDPRKSVRFLMGLAPILVPLAKSGLQQADIPGAEEIELDFSVADLPPAELVAKPLFPNVATCTADDDGLTWTSRTSLPSIPLVGNSGVAATAVAVALLLPAVQAARTAARRTESQNNVRQISLALHNYHAAHGSFPQGTHPNDDLKPEKRLSWLADILEFLDQAQLSNRIDFDEAWDSDANGNLLKTKIATFQNPGVADDKDSKYGTTHYVGIAGIGKDAATLPITDKNAGVFGYNRKTRIRDITDGTSNTLMISAASKSFGPWGAGGTATIRGFVKKPYINGPDGIGGPYTGGCYMGLCDGAVRFISEKIDPEVLENLARIHDGNPVGGF